MTTRLDNRPAFLLQNLDGSDAQRLHFQNVTDVIPGNLTDLTLSDDALLTVARPRWSPLGTRVAVVASAAFDQSEVVIFDVTSGGAFVASPNTQMIAGAVDWSPTGSAIAYAMSTIHASGVDLFMTNVGTLQVTRLTTGANLAQSVVRWSSTGGAVYFSRHVGDAKDAAGNWVSQVARVTLSSMVIDTVRSSILGEVQAIARSGQWALVLRKRSQGVDTFRADLVRLNLADGSETTLVTDEMITGAHLSPDEGRVLLALAIGPAGQTLVYDLIELSDGGRARIPGAGGAVEIDVSPRFFEL